LKKKNFNGHYYRKHKGILSMLKTQRVTSLQHEQHEGGACFWNCRNNQKTTKF